MANIFPKSKKISQQTIKTQWNGQTRIVLGIGLFFLLISISSFALAFFQVSNWRFVGFEKELFIILNDLGILSLGISGFCFISALFFKRDPVRKVVHRIILNTTLLFGGIFLAFVIMEGFLHLAYRDVLIGGIASPSRYTFYRNYYHLNRNGFRDTQHSFRKPEGTYRIVVVGDSFTFGAGIKRVDDLYFKILQKKLHQAYPNKRFEVVSLARKGWNTEQEFEVFRNGGIHFDPNAVIIGYVLNDAEFPEMKARVAQKFHQRHLLPYPYGKFLFATSFAYCIIEQKLKALPFLREEDNIWEAFVKEIYSGENLKEHERTLETFIDFINARGKRAIVVLFPDLRRIHDPEYPYFDIHQFVAQTVKRAGAEFLDLTEPIKKSGIQNLTVSQFDDHPSEEVHSLVGIELFKLMKRKGFLPWATVSLRTD